MKFPTTIIEETLEDLKTHVIPVMTGINCSIETYRYKILKLLKEHAQQHNNELPDTLEVPSFFPDTSIVLAYSLLQVPFDIQTDDTGNTKFINLKESFDDF